MWRKNSVYLSQFLKSRSGWQRAKRQICIIRHVNDVSDLQCVHYDSYWWDHNVLRWLPRVMQRSWDIANSIYRQLAAQRRRRRRALKKSDTDALFPDIEPRQKTRKAYCHRDNALCCLLQLLKLIGFKNAVSQFFGLRREQNRKQEKACINLSSDFDESVAINLSDQTFAALNVYSKIRR